MPLQFNPNEEDGPKPLLTPTPFSSTGIRLRLLFLVGLLGLVIVAMYEAGKPENWEWMNFDKRPALEIDPTADLSPDAANPIDGSSEPRFSRNVSETGSTSAPISIISEQDSQPRSAADFLSSEEQQFDYPGAATRFWKRAFPDFDRQMSHTLMQCLREIRTGHPVADRSPEATQQLIQLLKIQRSNYHQKLFDQLTLTPDNSSQKRKLSERYYGSEEIWEKQIFPALESLTGASELTMGQQAAVQRLQPVLDSLVFDQVEDKTTVGWKGDSEAWLRMWEIVADPTSTKSTTSPDTAPSPEAVRRIQLMGQPDFYRGRHVRISGWALSGRKRLVAADSALPFEAYYELWLKPEDTNAGPFCVYAVDLPAGFPVLDETFQELEQNVQADCRFFKVRSFFAGDKRIQYAPLLLTANLTSIETKVAAEPTASQVGFAWLIPAIVGLPLIAVSIAWLAYRSSESPSFQPGERAKQKIDDSLHELKDAEGIETDLDRIAKLRDSMKDSS